MADKQR